MQASYAAEARSLCVIGSFRKREKLQLLNSLFSFRTFFGRKIFCQLAVVFQHSDFLVVNQELQSFNQLLLLKMFRSPRLRFEKIETVFLHQCMILGYISLEVEKTVYRQVTTRLSQQEY